ncbi:glutamate--cysteine ligase [Gordonia sp. CPCC 205515]|uniref:carboxylate-amine ligase n=1 Tax=Gordonia sp. CPCC 205515 TaxID=3140791 RepID=UPI003AF38127
MAPNPIAATARPAPPTLGVEEEFILVDPHSRRPVARNREVAEAARAHGVDLDLELTPCQVEIATPPCATGDEVLAELRRLRSVVATAAEDVGVRAIATGVPPTVPDHFPITDGRRYQQIGERFGMLAHEQGICGFHVHVGVPDRDIAVGVSNRLRPYLPILLALAANSAVYRGSDTGHASWRSILWSRWPAAGPPPYLRSRKHFESLVAMFVSSGAILDDHMVYWDIRPSDHLPTIEIRVGDVQQRADESAAIAVIVRGLVVRALDDLAYGSPAPMIDEEILAAAMWKAAHDGLDGDGIDVRTGEAARAITMLGDVIEVARDLSGEDAMIERAASRWRATGNGASRQRTAYAEGATAQDLVDTAIAEFTR